MGQFGRREEDEACVRIPNERKPWKEGGGGGSQRRGRSTRNPLKRRRWQGGSKPSGYWGAIVQMRRIL
jgi:hypothetical protein